MTRDRSTSDEALLLVLKHSKRIVYFVVEFREGLIEKWTKWPQKDHSSIVALTVEEITRIRELPHDPLQICS